MGKMDGQDSGMELFDDNCVFCGRKLRNKEGCVDTFNSVYCTACYEEMKLEPPPEDVREGE